MASCENTVETNLSMEHKPNGNLQKLEGILGPL
jgi:hypothetical protein